MSKRSNTLWFIIAATVFNVITTIISFALLLLFYIRVLAPRLPESAGSWSVLIIFIGAIVIAGLIYRITLKFLFKKINPEQHFTPIFGRRNPPKRRD